MKPQKPYFRKVLIANRGEIACRIIRTLRELKIPSVAIYASDDAESMHRYMADEAISLGEGSFLSSYLNPDAIIACAQKAGADAVHPGLGFLSENPHFSEKVSAAGLTFIGAKPQAMELLGDKVRAKQLMIANNIPVLPGTTEPLSSLTDLKDWAKKIGFPLILKACAGGGGRGMRVVHKEEDLQAAFAACQREAKAYFADDRVFCERYLARPRHIEIQILRDQHGNVIHLHERDCSIQRRHQKLFEEAPSPFLNDTQRQRLAEIAMKAVALTDYAGAATVEMILEDPDHPHFMEINTRLQVEHPITEMITGVDIVKEQIKIAAGEKLDTSPHPVHGWSMEARINAENSYEGFRPESGLIRGLTLPAGPFVRVDSHIYAGYELGSGYDSLLAKVIVWGKTRELALERMRRALGEFRLQGFTTTLAFHKRLISHPEFCKGKFSTHFIQENEDYLHAKNASTEDEARIKPKALSAIYFAQNPSL